MNPTAPHPAGSRLTGLHPAVLSDEPVCWPALPLDSWKDTCATLHMWTQIVGKVRLCLTPLVNHWWNVPLYVTARGLTTSRIPYGERAFELRFDFLAHQLVLETSDGLVKVLALGPRSVADFYQECMELLRSAGIEVRIWRMPVEIPDPIPFDEDRVHAAYDAEKVEIFWRILLTVDAAFQQFRTGYVGKVSPVHFFWGSFDLAVTRFSGRRAPEKPGADPVTREAYSHEVSSVGFWPGSGTMTGPAFYSYTAPEPAGFREARVRPEGAHYDAQLGEFLVMYDAVRSSASPSGALLAFCESTYDAGAEAGHWDRSALERWRQELGRGGNSMATECKHLDAMNISTTTKHVCEDCVKTGDHWVHLRLCLTCGHVGCCDSSKNKHATRHFHQSHHPLIRSIEPGEAWVWCYPDAAVVGEMRPQGFAASGT